MIQDLSNYIITSRIRLARNLTDLPFVIRDKRKSSAVILRVTNALKNDKVNLYYMDALPDLTIELLKEKNLISSYLAGNRHNGAVFISADQSLSIMINEEDVIREQCFENGLSLNECYARLNCIDDKLNSALNFSFDSQLGYLTACPTNVGTGMRASLMMFLPALTEFGKMNEINKKLTKKGMTIRGIHGEGSSSEGSMYQISNEVTLGVSEEQIISVMNSSAEMLCLAESQLIQENYLRDRDYIKDRCYRALAIAENCVLLSYKEFLSQLKYIKLGVVLDLFSVQSMSKLNELIVKLQPANLCYTADESLDARKRDAFRAQECAKYLKKVVKIKAEIK